MCLLRRPSIGQTEVRVTNMSSYLIKRTFRTTLLQKLISFHANASKHNLLRFLQIIDTSKQQKQKMYMIQRK